MKGVASANIFDAKIINNQEKQKKTPLVVPEARSEGALVVFMGVEAFIEKIVGEGAQMGKSIDSVSYPK